jgi:hypothetical protein
VESDKFWRKVLKNDLIGLTKQEIFATTSRGNLIGGEDSEAYKRVLKAGTLSALRDEVQGACRRGGGWS